MYLTFTKIVENLKLISANNNLMSFDNFYFLFFAFFFVVYLLLLQMQTGQTEF